MGEPRVAVMVDGDNISPTYAKRILGEAVKLGKVDLARVYASGLQPTDWFSMAGYRPMFAGAGKNATDILLSIDALEIALDGKFNSFVIASSDGDFSHLAHRMKERGLHVLGIGEQKAPQSFRQACSKFVVMQKPKPAAKKAAQQPCKTIEVPTPLKNDQVIFSDLDKNVHDAIRIHGDAGSKMAIAKLGARMNVSYTVLAADIPSKNWTKYLKSRPDLYSIRRKGDDDFVHVNSASLTPH